MEITETKDIRTRGEKGAEERIKQRSVKDKKKNQQIVTHLYVCEDSYS